MTELYLFMASIWGLYALAAFVGGYRQVKFKNNPYGLCRRFNLLGAFVWADAVIIGGFFTLVVAVSIYLSDYILLLLVIAVFWTIRSIGEQIYWFLEQFASNHRNPEHTLWFSKYFKRNSSWIAMQIYWQCISVICIIATVYLFAVWL